MIAALEHDITRRQYLNLVFIDHMVLVIEFKLRLLSPALAQEAQELVRLGVLFWADLL